jgi:hypothetical protein
MTVPPVAIAFAGRVAPVRDRLGDAALVPSRMPLPAPSAGPRSVPRKQAFG